jgi:hypothetical protein
LAKIAEGSVVLSLDAQQLNKGLASAATKAKQTGDKMGDAITGGGKGGGSAAGWMKAGFWGAVGAGMAIGIFEGVKGIGEGLKWLGEKALDLKDKLQSGKLTLPPALSKGVGLATSTLEKLGESIDTIAAGAITALAPTFAMVAEVIQGWLPTLQPVFAWLGQVLETTVSLGFELFDALASVISPIVDAVTNWIDETFALGEQWGTVESVIVGALKAVAKVGAYAWDVLKVGAGGVAIAVGYLVKSFGTLIDGFKNIANLADKLPIKPAWLSSFQVGLSAISIGTKKAGNDIMDWGQSQIDAFGQSAQAMDFAIDALAMKARQRRERAVKDAEEVRAKLEYKAVAAVEFGSKDFASSRARFQTEGLLRNVAKEQLKEQKEANRLLGKVVDGLKDIKPLGFQIF